MLPLLPDAFRGIKQIVVIGWGSQVLAFILYNAIIFFTCLLLKFLILIL